MHLCDIVSVNGESMPVHLTSGMKWHIYLRFYIIQGRQDCTMRREKKTDTYFSLLSMTILSTILTACGTQDSMPLNGTRQEEVIQRPSETYSCSVQELSSYLQGYESDCPYIGADITISGYSVEPSDEYYWNWDLSMTTGDAEVTWQFFDSLEQMESALAVESEKKEGAARSETNNETDTEEDNMSSDTEIRMLYYAFPLSEDVCALDIYHTMNERYGTEEEPFWAIGGTSGTVYYYVQETIGEDGSTSLYPHRSAVNLYIKDRFAYGLVPQSIPDTYSDEEINLFFRDYLNDLGGDADYGWGLSEEDLYWIDHEERVTSMEEPDRSFVEIRGIDENWELSGYEGIMTYFGMLKEADYEVPLTEGGPILDIHLFTAANPSEGEYRYYLLNGFCMDEEYHMTVTDQETGRELQRGRVNLSVEITDTIIFKDLNADGYVDMQIDRPVHWSGIPASIESWSTCDYMLWNPEKEAFERKTWEEVRDSSPANQNTAAEGYTEYVVQSGDCLWSISERFLGSGFYWTMLQRDENASEDPDYLLPGEIIRIPE